MGKQVWANNICSDFLTELGNFLHSFPFLKSICLDPPFCWGYFDNQICVKVIWEMSYFKCLSSCGNQYPQSPKPWNLLFLTWTYSPEKKVCRGLTIVQSVLFMSSWYNFVGENMIHSMYYIHTLSVVPLYGNTLG